MSEVPLYIVEHGAPLRTSQPSALALPSSISVQLISSFSWKRVRFRPKVDGLVPHTQRVNLSIVGQPDRDLRRCWCRGGCYECVCMYVCVCVCVRKSVCVREREKEGERVGVYVYVCVQCYNVEYAAQPWTLHPEPLLVNPKP